MKIREMRIPLPMSLDQYHVAQMWSFNEQSRRETGGGEGVEIVKNEPYTGVPLFNGKYDSGQYTYKIYHVETKIPAFLKTLLKPVVGKNGFQLHEEAWNAFPYCKTVITNPNYMKDDFKVILETLHVEDDGTTDNVLNMSADEYKKVEQRTLDIIADKGSLRDKDMDPVTFRSEKMALGPLDAKTWRKTTKPIMTCYKFVSVHFKWFGLQNKTEGFILDQYCKMLLALHQQMWCWADQWHGLTMADIRALEAETKKELEKEIKTKDKKGTKIVD